MAKQKTVQDLYPLVEALSTADQLELKKFLEKVLKEKADKAADELDLINGNKQ